MDTDTDTDTDTATAVTDTVVLTPVLATQVRTPDLVVVTLEWRLTRLPLRSLLIVASDR